MSQDFSKFDEFKRDLGDKWRFISIYDIAGQEDLNLDGLKLYFISLMNKKLNVVAYIDKLFKRAKQEFLLFKITEEFKGTEENQNGTLKKYFRSDL